MILKIAKYIYRKFNILNFFDSLYNLYLKFIFKRVTKRLKKYGDVNDLNSKTKILYPNKVEIGSYIYIGPNGYINGLGGVSIKSGTIIGPNLVIHSANHKYKQAKYLPYDESFDFRKVIIKENVWIGGNVIITPGSEIGEGCIIGAGTVVSGKIPDLSIVVGNPCRVIKKRDKDHYFKLKNEGKIYLKEKLNKTNKFENK